MISLKRIYEKPSKQDGYRVLVDRLWPRGINKKTARLDAWEKNLAPSNNLRKWIHQNKDKWNEFKKLYSKEIKDKKSELIDLKKRSKNSNVTLLYAAKDEKQNNAVALKEIIQKTK